MRQEACVIVTPVLWNTHPGVVELWARRRINRERRPKAYQYQRQHDDLRSHPRESQNKQKDVSQSDLGERVLECELGLRRTQRTQKDSQYDKQKRAPDGMTQHLWKGLPLPRSTRD